MSSFKLAEAGSLNTAVNTSEVSWWAFHRIDSDDLRHSLRIAVWVRWFVGIAWFAQLNYRADFSHEAYIPHTLLAASLLALNAYVHYRIRSNRQLKAGHAKIHLALGVRPSARWTSLRSRQG